MLYLLVCTLLAVTTMWWSVNKLLILSFLLFFTSVYQYPKQKKIGVCSLSQLYNIAIDCLHAMSLFATMYGAWWLVHRNAQVLYIIVCTLFAVCQLKYRQCGLADHNVVESANKHQILSFLLFSREGNHILSRKKLAFVFNRNLYSEHSISVGCCAGLCGLVKHKTRSWIPY